MLGLSDRTQPNARRRALAAGLAVSALALLGSELAAAWAQAEPAAVSRAALRRQVEARYLVSPLPDGVRLEPREARSGVTFIEVAGDRVAVNGATVPREVLEAWLEDDAELVLLLADLRPPARRALFGFEAAAPSPEAPREGPAVVPEPPAPPVAVEAPAPAPPRPPAPPAPPERDLVRRVGSQFTLFRDLLVDGDESASEATAVLGSVRVAGEVRNDVVAVLGSVGVEGQVGGGIVAVLGSVHLGPEAEVRGGAVVVGGRISTAPGARLEGDIVEIPLLGFAERPWPGAPARRLFGWWWSAFWTVLWLVLAGLLAALTLLVGREAVERTADKVAEGWWKAGLVGFLAEICFFPLLALTTVLLAISIVGVALLVPLYMILPIVVLLVSLVGYTGVARCSGRSLLGAVGAAGAGSFPTVVVGVAALHLPLLVGILLRGTAEWSLVLGPVGSFLVLAGLVIQWAAWTVGVGAALLDLLARRRGRTPAASGPPPVPPSDLEAGAAAADTILAVPPLPADRRPRGGSEDDERRGRDAAEDT